MERRCPHRRRAGDEPAPFPLGSASQNTVALDAQRFAGEDTGAPRELGNRPCSLRTPYRFAIVLLIASCAHREQPPLNVLLVTLDTFRADRVGARTPNLNRLAKDAVVFTNADATVPLTLPSHATILSGLLPLHHGITGNGGAVFKQSTLATVLSARGYRTGAFVSSFVLDHRFGLNGGFETYDDAIERKLDENASQFDVERKGGDTVDRALAWLGRADSRPFFAWVHLYDAHFPYQPSYDDEIAYVDAQVGRLLAAVDRTKTVIVVVADHGEGLGDHGESTHGLLLYESTLHVPLLVAAPSLKQRVVDAAVSTVDVAPTIASLAGAEMTADGRDLLGNATSDVYAETQYPTVFGWSALQSMRRGDTKVISGAMVEAFDLGADPNETRNVANDRRREVRDLSQRFSALRSTATTTNVDSETQAKLRSLGYVAPSNGARASSSAQDPRTMVALLNDYDRAEALLRRGEAASAATILAPLVDRDPSNSVFRGALARAQRQLGRLAEAIRLYRATVALAPADADAWYNLGVTLQSSGNSAEALAALEEAVRLDPKRAEAFDALGVVRIEAGQIQPAADAFARATSIDPMSARSWNNLGNAMRALGRPSDAATAYTKASELAPSFADPRNGLGVLLVQQGRSREAIALFDAALKLAPDFYEAQLNRGIARQESGDAAGAAAEYRALLARLPKGPLVAEQRKAAQTLLSRLTR